MQRLHSILYQSPLIIAGIYLIFSAVWIAYSDIWVLSYVDDPEMITTIQTYKGWFFISVSAVFIYFLVLSSYKTILKLFRKKLDVEYIFEATFEQAAVGIIHQGFDNRSLRFNSKVCEMFNYSRLELKKIGLRQLAHPDDLKAETELDQKLLDGTTNAYQIEMRYRRKDNSLLNLLLSKSIALDEKKKPMFFVSVLEDITHLKETEKILERVYQMAEIGNWKYDLQSNEMDWSKDVKIIHEVSPSFEPDLDKLIQFFKNDSDRETIRNAFASCMDTGEPFDVESQIVTAKGMGRWIRLIGEAEFLNGVCLYLFGSIQNIDSRKNAELQYQELYNREKSERLQIEQINQGLKLLDQVGTLFAEPGLNLESIFHKTADLLVDEIADICSIDLWDGVQFHRVTQKVKIPDTAALLNRIQKGDPKPYYDTELMMQVVKSGEPIFYRDLEEDEIEKLVKLQDHIGYIKKLQVHSISILPLKGSDEISGIITLEMIGRQERYFSSDEDIFLTELANKLSLFLENLQMREDLKNFNKKLETKVALRTRQLEIINEELESFSYSVSHDLRSPLRAISGYTNLLLEDHRKGLNAEGREFLEIVKSESGRMGKLIDDLLSFSRISRTGLNEREVHMNELVNKSIDEVKMSNSELPSDFEVEPLDSVIGDPDLLQQVWVNLISNAVKYRHKDQIPKIKIKSIVDETDRSITYSIQDDGVGFDMKYMDKLFGVFQRLHSDVEFEGTGIGLALAKRIINRHDGTIWAESEPGKGSTFHFTLPINLNE